MMRSCRLLRSYLKILVLIVCIWPSGANGQDRIFTLDGDIIHCEISAIDEKRLSYTYLNNSSGPDILMKLKEIAFVVFEAQNLNVFEGKNPYDIPFTQDGYDLLLLNTKQFMPVDSVVFQGHGVKAVSLSNSSPRPVSFDQSEVLAKWDRYGEFIPYASLEIVRNALLEAQPVMANSIPSKKEDTGSLPTFGGNEPPPTNPEDSPFRSESSLDNIVFHIDEEIFKQKALAKVKRLSELILVISDKSISRMDLSKAINQALVLFVHDTTNVQVSSLNRPQDLKSFYIRQYLPRLNELKYDKVEITWSDINYVSKIRKDSFGRYWGLVSFVQRFRGFKDGRVMYSDKVKKTVTVFFKSYKKFSNGLGEDQWDVLLSDIMVEHTEAD